MLLSINVFPQTLNDMSLYEVVNQTSELNDISQIDVGDSPLALEINEYLDTVYVASYDSNTISVISRSHLWVKGVNIPIYEFFL
jgi:DNA-binding beta-propeller fold protein YncE